MAAKPTLPEMPGTPTFNEPDPTASTPPGIGDGFAAGMGALVGGAAALGRSFLEGLDLSKVQESNYVKLPEGEDRDFIITRARVEKAATGTPMLKMDWVVTDDYPEAGGKLGENIALTTNVMWKFKALLRACDLLSEDGSTPLITDFSDLNGCVVTAKTKIEMWKQEPRCKVDGTARVPEGGPRRVEMDGTPSGPGAPGAAAPDGMPNFG